MLTVLIDSGNAPPRTGIGIYGDGLLRALSTYGRGQVVVREAGASSTARSLRPLRRAVHFVRLNNLRRKGFGGSDVVHFTNYYVPPRARGTAYVATIHDLDPITLPEAHTRRYSMYFERSITMLLRRATVIETHTRAVCDEVCERYGVEGSSFMIAGDGLSEDFMKKVDASQPTLPDEPVLLYVGLICAKKNTAWLVRSVARGIARGALPRMRLIVAGRAGFGHHEVESALRDSGGTSTWIQSPSFDEVVRLYCTCTTVVLPSVREGFGRPLLEGMYCGKSLVASRIPSSCEVGGDAAAFFALGNDDEFYAAVRQAITDHEKPEHRAAAQRQLARYSWERLAGMYTQIYQEACTRHRAEGDGEERA